VIPGYTALFLPNRYSSEWSTLFVPRHPIPTKRAVFYSHGAAGNGAQALGFGNLPNIAKMMGKAALNGFVILSGDFGGPQTYGNDSEVAAMETAWAWLKTTGLCATDKVILTGASMGSLSSHRFAADHPGWVAGMNLWMPAIDPDDLRNRNALGTTDLINTAWSLLAGSTVATGGAPIPTKGQPLQRLADYQAIPTHLWYSTADTVTLSSIIDTYAAGRPNVTKHSTSTSADHGDGVVAGTDFAAVLAFLDSVA
jgi:hypothetical protein